MASQKVRSPALRRDRDTTAPCLSNFVRRHQPCDDAFLCSTSGGPGHGKIHGASGSCGRAAGQGQLGLAAGAGPGLWFILVPGLLIPIRRQLEGQVAAGRGVQCPDPAGEGDGDAACSGSIPGDLLCWQRGRGQIRLECGGELVRREFIRAGNGVFLWPQLGVPQQRLQVLDLAGQRLRP